MSTKRFNHNDVKTGILDSRACPLVEKAACPGQAGHSWGQVQSPPCCVRPEGQGAGLAHEACVCTQQGYRGCCCVLL